MINNKEKEIHAHIKTLVITPKQTNGLFCFFRFEHW